MNKENEMDSAELMEAMLACIQAECFECKDPYDLYINRLKASVFANPTEVSSRIDAGYQVLIKHIVSTQDDKMTND